MRKGNVQLKTAGLLLILVSVFAFAAGAVNIRQSIDEMDSSRADLIMIDSLKSLGNLERPPVPFLHSRHTKVLAKINRDCSSCHMAKDGKLSPKFKRIEDTGKKGVMELYHQNCITCHKEIKAQLETTGPVTCGGCHVEDHLISSSRQPAGLDKSLHYRHVRANEKKCERCHHEYNEKEKKLFYAKGKEGSCVYCHKAATAGDVSSRKTASHISCIGCHRERIAANRPAGPDSCLGCHDRTSQSGYEVVKDLPRMEHRQPDVVYIGSGDKGADGKTMDSGMFDVPFNHKSHETYNQSCRVCHHASLEGCTKCHTNSSGVEKGKFINLEQAMHRKNAAQSCVGCHKAKQKAPECAGCHTAIGSWKKPQDESCRTCHMKPPVPGFSGDKVAMESMAGKMLNSGNLEKDKIPASKIPEKVVLEKLKDQYGPVEFPHGKIVRKLVSDISGSRLAGVFHGTGETVCQGCHHNSPAATNPPRCSSCHDKPFDDGGQFKPGLSGAYHQQCFQCHFEMGIKKPASRDCTSCHVEKKRG